MIIDNDLLSDRKHRHNVRQMFRESLVERIVVVLDYFQSQFHTHTSKEKQSTNRYLTALRCRISKVSYHRRRCRRRRRFDVVQLSLQRRRSSSFDSSSELCYQFCCRYCCCCCCCCFDSFSSFHSEIPIRRAQRARRLRCPRTTFA